MEAELVALSKVSKRQAELASRIDSLELSLQVLDDDTINLNSSRTETVESKVNGNYVEGSRADDKLHGTDGDDLFDGKGGNDQIDGGMGIDTLLIFENSSNFKVITLGGVTKVTGLKKRLAIYGYENTITLTNVEYIQFADKPVSLVEASKEEEGDNKQESTIKFP